jgi:hypothetical protein
MVDAEAVSSERLLMPLLVRAAALLSSTFIVTLHLCLERARGRDYVTR